LAEKYGVKFGEIESGWLNERGMINNAEFQRLKNSGVYPKINDPIHH
jgi:hypothetical protein